MFGDTIMIRTAKSHSTLFLFAAAAWALGSTDRASAQPPVEVLHRTVKVGDLDIFYREAGPKDAPTVLLLHGFPTSSQMYRKPIPALGDRYHMVAPDYPGFGHSSMPAHDQFRDCITKDTPTPFITPNTTFGYTPGHHPGGLYVVSWASRPRATRKPPWGPSWPVGR
jgi:hypothetical protein